MLQKDIDKFQFLDNVICHILKASTCDRQSK